MNLPVAGPAWDQDGAVIVSMIRGL